MVIGFTVFKISPFNFNWLYRYGMPIKRFAILGAIAFGLQVAILFSSLGLSVKLLLFNP